MLDDTYILDGQILRESLSTRRVLSRHFNRSRFVLLSSVVLILLATNPANRPFLEEITAPFLGRNGRVGKGWFKTTTNYGLLSLEENPASIDIHGLGTFWTCHFYDPNLGHACEWIGV